MLALPLSSSVEQVRTYADNTMSYRAKSSFAQLEELVVLLGAEEDIQWFNLPLRSQHLLRFIIPEAQIFIFRN